MSVQDDGQGFDPASAKAGMGLSNMRARIDEMGGTLKVQSAPDQGASVVAEVPLITQRELRERTQREKEDRYQQVYWAAGATSMLASIVVMGVIALLVMAIEIASGNPNMWAAFILTLAISTAMVLGLLFVTINLRRRVAALGDERSIWHACRRHNDAALALFIAGALAWVSFSFKHFGLSVAFALLAMLAAIISHRLQGDIDRRIAEWATFRMLRTRMGEHRVLLVFGLVLIGLALAGMFGDVREFQIFHERFDSAWTISFILFAYPLLVISSGFALINTRRQLSLLEAVETDDEAMDVPQPASIKQQRRLARMLTGSFMASAALTGVGFGRGSVLLGIAGMVACVIFWFMKSRIEGGLTEGVGEWSTLEKQRSAQMMYTYFLLLAGVMIAGGFIGGVIGYTTPASEGDAGDSAAALPRLLGLLAAVAAAPAYLVMMLAVTRRRIRRWVGEHVQNG
jgi:hypothetical protein